MHCAAARDKHELYKHTYLAALRGGAGHGFEGGREGGIKGDGRAADAAEAGDPGGVVAGVDGDKQCLRRRPDLGPDNVGGVLSNRSAGGYGGDGSAGGEACQELEAEFVAGLHLEDGVGP